MHSAPDPLDMIINAFWYSPNGLYLFVLFLFSDFYILNDLNFKISQRKSFPTEKIWKNSLKYFGFFSFWFLYFHNFILCFDIFYKFSLHMNCFKCLKILLYIFKFWKTYGMIQWYCDKYWWPYFVFVSEFSIFFLSFLVYFTHFI